MKLGKLLAGGVALLGVGAPACLYPDFGFEPSGGAGGTATGTATGGGVGGSTSTGTAVGAGGTGTAVGAGGTATGSGGTGGTPPTPCELWGTEVCGSQQKCSVINTTTGETACVDAGQRPAWAYCLADTECVDRTWCDLEAQVCKPICEDGNDCLSGANCLTAHVSGGGAIPGLEVCNAKCDPRLINSCNQTYGNVNCVYVPSVGFDCMSTGNLPEYADCSDSRQCAPNLGCYLFAFEWCRPWCEVGSDTCPGLPVCLAHNPPVYYDGTELGSCG